MTEPALVSDLARRLVAVAKGELSSFGGVPETDPRLRKRINDTYLAQLRAADPDNDVGWAMDADITKWAWSATFVSWCVLSAGVTAKQFAFSVRHSVFLKAAIANAAADRGKFRAWPIDVYAPVPGDIVVKNRGGGTVTYDQAPNVSSFESHSAIVADLIVRDGKKYAITIGGNEADSVHSAQVELTAGGKVKQRTGNPYIAVIQNLATDPVALVERAPLAADIGLPAAFRGHGTFVYLMADTMADYGSADNMAAAMKRAGMDHAWVRIHGRKNDDAATIAVTRKGIDALKRAGIAVAGWGWCQGEDPAGEARIAIKALATYGLEDYVADIEHGVGNANWTVTEVHTICAALRKGVKGGLAVSSFALIGWHEPQLMRAAADYVDAVAPQIYWHDYPDHKMIQQFHRTDGSNYALRDPGAYADLCIDSWKKAMGSAQKPIVLTGQAYWGEGIDQADAEAKLIAFLDDWRRYGKIAGLNWWHFGGNSGMSHAMLETITAAKLGDKTYAA